jgi:vacuolar protein sorting-associated protein 35
MIKAEPGADQELILDETQTRASQCAALMKKSLESGNLRDALKHASSMLTELKCPDISPKYYYILCMSKEVN